MSKRVKRQISRELAAIASLKDSDIDTSDIPEITDWSQAVVGSVYGFGKTAPSLPSAAGVGFKPRYLPEPDAQQFTGIVLSGTTVPKQSFTGANLAEMTSRQLIVHCVQNQAPAWGEFIRRYHRLIATVVVRTGIRRGYTSPEVTEDLIQEVYLRLSENFRLLRQVELRHENALVGYLKAVTANVVHDYLRSAYSTKRAATGSTSDELNPDLVALESSGAVAEVENAVFMEEIDRALKAGASERDRSMFWLHYRHGLTAKEIASIPELNLTVKGVESTIHRLTRALRHELAQALPARPSEH